MTVDIVTFESAALRDIEAELRARGFQRFVQPAVGDGGRTVLWQRALGWVVPGCLYNDTLRLTVSLFEFRRAAPHIDHVAVEVGLHAQLPDEQWARLTLTPDMPSSLCAELSAMQTKLVAAWQALAALSQPEDLECFVIRYADGAYNLGPEQRNGFPVRLAEATRYATLEQAREKCRDLPEDVRILTVRQALAEGDEA